MDSSGGGILSGPIDLDEPRRARHLYRTVEAVAGLVVEHRASGLVGAVVRVAGGMVTLRDNRGRECPVRMLPGGFLINNRPVTLAAPAAPAPASNAAAPRRTASGSVAVEGAAARVARASRILVEGVHDAELVEKVWGDDLRLEGVVVERLDGMNYLAEAVLDFRPGPGRRLGVLLDHLVDGSKEWRAAQALTSAHVLITGTPYVDVWAAVRPTLLGLDRWPDVPRHIPWKDGICVALGEPDPAVVWRRILASVRSYADLEPSLVGAVERLIDFVTAP